MNWPGHAARWRVRLGYPVAILVLWLAHPTPTSILGGTIVGAMGISLRAWAAGYLQKQSVLTVAGPYAYTRNPLYLGSAVLAVGAAIAVNSWVAAAIIGAYFALFYSVVMRREEQELRMQHGEAFDEYARAVPLFFPRMTAAKVSWGDAGTFSLVQYKKNREYRATAGFFLLMIVLALKWRLNLP
jgi:protein-S-isoprenylcysteine O-methyltransferase Ste14